MAESLKLTIQRTLPYWNDQIVPDVSEEVIYMKLAKKVSL